MAYTDKTLSCVDCQTPFTFSARDQEFHASKGFTNEPKRCASCRQGRRVQRGDPPAGVGTGAPAQRTVQPPVYSGPRAQSRPSTGRDFGRARGPRRDFDRGSRGNGDGGGGGGGQRTFEASESPRSYTAACMACGEETNVSADAGNRVIFCSDCYSKMTAMASS